MSVDDKHIGAPNYRGPQENADWERANYGGTRPQTAGARIASVIPMSPADDVGLAPGHVIVQVNGIPLNDIITWRWESADYFLELNVAGFDDLVYLERESGQDWGIEFDDVIFDGVRTCHNACTFCFMTMLPKGMRASLYLRDDDYRLSFLQGNFVTLTNMNETDVERVIRMKLEPMNVSLHAISPEVRATMMGKNAARGMEVLERLCAENIEVHAQIVLCPGVNDGDELIRTLNWVEAHNNITSLAIVPLGYTRFSPHFSSSYSDDPKRALEVLDLVRPYQDRARASLGVTRFQLSDEFYLIAKQAVPEADFYDGYPQFYDGIGMLRSFMDDVDRVAQERRSAEVRAALKSNGQKVRIVCGHAANAVMNYMIEKFELGEFVRVQPIDNDFFGGNVDVTGLLCAEDVLAQLPFSLLGELVLLPENMFNADKVTLDEWSSDKLVEAVEARGGRALVCSTYPEAFLSSLAALS